MMKKISEVVKRSIVTCSSGYVIISTVLIKVSTTRPYYETAILDNKKVIVVDETFSKREATANHWYWEKFMVTQNPVTIKAYGEETSIDYIIDEKKEEEIYQICWE